MVPWSHGPMSHVRGSPLYMGSPHMGNYDKRCLLLNLQISVKYQHFAPTQTLIMSLLSCLSASSRFALRAPLINTVSMQRRNVMIEYVKQLKNGKLEDPMYVSLRLMVMSMFTDTGPFRNLTDDLICYTFCKDFYAFEPSR